VAALSQALRRLGVEASEEGGSALTDCVAVQLVLSLLHWIDHPGDTAARFHVATSPLGPAVGLLPGIGDDAAAALADRLRRNLLERGYGRCLGEWSTVLAPHCDERGVNRLVQLIDLAHQYSPYATLRPREFVEFVSAQRVVQPSAARVRLLTIHKSKGLEFDVVCLPELDAPMVQSSQSHVTGHRCEVDPPDTVIRYANQQIVSLLPAELQQVFQADRERKIEERLCVLYVALTRARHALHLMIAPSKPSEKKLSLSMAHLLRAGLTDGRRLPPGFQQTITGDAEWWRRVPRFAQPAAEVAEAPGDAPRLQITLAPPRADGLANRQAVSPSRHGFRTVPMTDVLTTKRAVGRTRGVLIHAWFEQTEWTEDGPPDDATLRRMARRLEPHGLDVDRCLRDFHAMLRSPDIAWALSRQAYLTAEGLFAAVHAQPSAEGELTLQVQSERHFAAPLGNDIVRGTIDRLVLLARSGEVVAADIIDYKTDALDKLPPDTAAERLAGYQTQLRLYRRAVAHLYGLPVDCVTARLVLLGAGRVEEVVGRIED
jgi:ATP-dependent exoDNAse (exonuclease V) beta subunit